MKMSFQKISEFFWPKYGWVRTSRHLVKKLLRLSSTPYSIAAGVAVGVGVSFTPFVGLHFVISFAIAYIIGGNIFAAAIGTSAGNPITFPFIWASIYALGNKILGLKHASNHEVQLSRELIFHGGEKIWPLLKTMIIGGIPLALIVGLITYFITNYAVSRFQQKRAMKRKMFQLQQYNKKKQENLSNKSFSKKNEI